jgi:hypothetical protein
MPQVDSLRQRYKSLLENFMDFYKYSQKLLEDHMTEGGDARLKPSDVKEIDLDGFKVANGFKLIAV